MGVFGLTRHEGIHPMFNKLLIAGAMAVGSFGFAGTAAAEPPLVVDTVVVDDATETIDFGNPCNGAFGTAELSYRFTQHVTALDEDRYMVRGSAVGKWDFTPVVGEAASGRFNDSFRDLVTDVTQQLTLRTIVRGETESGEAVRFTLLFKIKIVDGTIVVLEDGASC